MEQSHTWRHPWRPILSKGDSNYHIQCHEDRHPSPRPSLFTYTNAVSRISISIDRKRESTALCQQAGGESLEVLHRIMRSSTKTARGAAAGSQSRGGTQKTGNAMQATATRLTGIGSGAKKYDVLSALALAGLDNAALPSQRALRFIALITIRYNWANDMLSVGHAELTQLWKVSRRTVIREMEALRNLGVLVVLRPGRRGAVTTYRLDISAIRRLTGASLLSEKTGIDSRLAAVGNGVDGEPPLVAEPTGPSSTESARSPSMGLWQAVIERLPPSVSCAQKDRWLAPLRAKQCDDILQVEAESAFRASYVAQTFSDALLAAARPLGIRRVAIIVASQNAQRLHHCGSAD